MQYGPFRHLDVAIDDDVATLTIERSKRSINAAVVAPDPAAAREREASLWWEQFESEERRERIDEFLEE